MQRLCAGLLIGSAIAWAGAACAQDQPSYSSTDPTAAVPSAQPQNPPLETPAPSEAVATSSEAPLFVLTQVRFHGVLAVPAERLEEAWRPYAGRRVSFDDLRRIGRAAELVYAQAGYPFVAVVLTPQQVEGGVVEYRVVEGHISDLTVLGLDPVARRQATEAFQPLVGRTPLPIGDVEAAYHSASDIPGLSLAGSLRRGSEPGGMDLVIQARRRTWRAYANVNNYYSDPVGPWGVVLGAEYNGASRYGDRTTFQIYSTTETGEQTVLKFGHWRALTSRGTTLEFGYTRAWAEPQGAVAQLDLATDVNLGFITFGQRILARGPFELTGRVGFEATDQETKVFNNIGLTEDRLRIFTLGADWEWRRGRYSFDGGFELRQGVNGLGSSQRGDADLSRLDANPQALVTRGSARGQVDLPWSWAFNATVLGQYSANSLTAPEEFSAGNLTIGRGYLPGASYGDSAIAGAFELWGPPARMPRGFSIRPFAYYDAVHVWNAEIGAPDDHTLRSFGGGLRFDMDGRFRVDLTFTRPLDPPLGFGEPTPGRSVLLNVTIGIPDAFRGISRLFRRESRS